VVDEWRARPIVLVINVVVSADDVVLLDVSSIAEAFPGRWWVPPAEMLAVVTPECAFVKVMALERNGGGIWEARPVWIDVEECDAEKATGTIVDSEFEHGGYSEGDRLSAPWACVFDVALLDDDGDELFNESRARFAIGKRVLIGITVLSPDETVVLDRHAFAGTVASVDAKRGLELTLDDRSSYWLPPDTSSLLEARPGEYQLRGTGQTIVDPAYTATWTITHSGAEPFQLSDSGFAPRGDVPG
jgi:hypothetical protein